MKITANVGEPTELPCLTPTTITAPSVWGRRSSRCALQYSWGHHSTLHALMVPKQCFKKLSMWQHT
jgi:hypothetical protein